MGKIRCPLRPDSMALDRDRPEILAPPEHPPACCTQQTITVPAEINAKTAQKHDYPSKAHRRSYARRTGAERGFATVKDPAATDITRGWCRLMGLAPLMLFTTTLLIVRNQRTLAAWNTTAGRKPAPRRRRAPAQNTAPAPQDNPRHPRRGAAVTTDPRPGRAHPAANAGRQQQQPGTRRQRLPGTSPPNTQRHHDSTRRTAPQHPRAPQNVRPKRENGPHRNVKTSGAPAIGLEPITWPVHRRSVLAQTTETSTLSTLRCLHTGLSGW